MNIQQIAHTSLHRTNDDDCARSATLAADSADLSEAHADAAPLSWKQRLFVVMLFLLALVLSFAAVCSIDPPAAVLYRPTAPAAAQTAGSSWR